MNSVPRTPTIKLPEHKNTYILYLVDMEKNLTTHVTGTYRQCTQTYDDVFRQIYSDGMRAVSVSQYQNQRVLLLGKNGFTYYVIFMLLIKETETGENDDQIG